MCVFLSFYICGNLSYSNRKQEQLHTKNCHTKPSGHAKVGTKFRVTSEEAEVFGGGLREGFVKAATSNFIPGLLRQPHAIHPSWVLPHVPAEVA